MQSFRDLYSDIFLLEFGNKVVNIYKQFQVPTFIEHVKENNWEDLAYKQRVRNISQALLQTLPDDYEKSVDILIKLGKQCFGVEYIFLPDYIELCGMDNYELSIHALSQLTESSTSEFAVRPFIEKYPERMLEQLLQWSKSDNEHIRRLSSEGCRPLLPWSYRLNCFVEDPTPIIRILDILIQDNSLYVLKSVANNLNDIAKHHPSLVKEFVKKWINHTPLIDKTLKHGCRTLLKSTDEQVLAFFGLKKLVKSSVEEFKVTPVVAMGDKMEFSFQIVNQEQTPVQIRIDYEIGFMKNNGTIRGKKFRLSEKEYASGITNITRTHSFAPITTRIYYPGAHTITIYLNSTAYSTLSFELIQ